VVKRPGRDRVAAVSGVLFVVVLSAGLYVAPDLVYPEEQVGGVSGTFYVNYESRLLAQAVLVGVASVLFLFFTDALGFDPEVASAVAGADVVQENGPERREVKQQLWSAIEAGAPPNALLASSSSGIPASVMGQAMRQPGRLVIGHPFNPPHLVPLVEVVPSPGTDPEVVDAAVAFYRAMGKQPQVLSREIPGFVANRLQAALFREAVHLVAQGVVTEQELDAVVTSSTGMRWAVAGPFQTFHLGVDLAAWPTSSCTWVRAWRPCGRSWASRAWMPTRPGSSPPRPSTSAEPGGAGNPSRSGADPPDASLGRTRHRATAGAMSHQRPQSRQGA
jgi:3-hydroxyacyl-CoA dehydrogenase, NAD binding domain/3-hydroxyacyl-CoA dehydrogenase, C-terminal domain